MITVGQEKITAKRNLSDIFPVEITNRKLFNEYIQYILNNYFEKSKEKAISSYIGNVVENFDGTDTYLKEPTAERQLNQIIPVLKSGDDKITFSNYIADLHNEGCTIYDQNKLLASKFWSWCPPINVDAFVNFVNYVWIGYPYEEDDIKIFYGYINVKDEFIDKKSIVYREYNEEGEETFSYTFKEGDIVCFPNDTSHTYNAAPYKVRINKTGDGRVTNVRFQSLSVPLIIIAKETNISTDAIGMKNYTIEDTEREFKFDLVNGMRIRFLNDANVECNNISYIVQGVGESIKFEEDSYNPYQNVEDHSTATSPIFKPDYFVMERGSIDGNDWSRLNRWVQRRALEAMNIASMEASASDGALRRGRKPIIIFNKDIELYNSGSFDRGIVKYAADLKSSDINGTSLGNWSSGTYILENGDILLLLGNVGSSSYQLYKVRVVDSVVYLDILINGQTDDGSCIQGDTVKVRYGDNAGKVLYYNGFEWVTGQTKKTLNQQPLFNLYDTDKISLDNPVTYPNSTFKGCTLFQYQHPTNFTNDEDLDMPIHVDDDDPSNIYFESTLVTDKFYYTPENDYQKEITGYRLYRNSKEDSYLNDWHLSKSSSEQYLKTRIEIYDDGKKYPFVYIDTNSYNDYVKGESDTYTIYTKNDNERLETYISRMETLAENKSVFRVYVLNLKYKPIVSDERKALIVTNNDIEVTAELIKSLESDTKYYIRDTEIGDVLVIKLLPESVESLDKDYVYEYPLSLTVNQFNKDINVITYNQCFKQLTDIIQNQVDLDGSPIGSNNYSSIKPDVSVGTMIVQTPYSVIRSMILNNNSDTSIRASITYAQNAYTKFKQKFINLIETENSKGNIIETQENYSYLEANPEEMDDMIISVINKINIGKEGLMPFYNNGVLTILDNAYVPATPAYLGIANCYEPRIETWEGYTLDVKPSVVVGHDGSLTRASNSVKDLYLLRLEQLIYQSIESKFKDTRCGYNIYPFLPGKFRKNTYSRQEVLNSYSPLFEKWCAEQNISYIENNKFRYDSLDVDSSCWKTWNYTGCIDKDGEPLYGSYRSIYIYYYDTYRPDTHPWEMLGLGDKPSWWEGTYGQEPYTSENIVMWNDIENGIIKKGPYAGEYQELKRPGLVEKYMPVDETGKLKNPIDAGIISENPTVQQARKKWVIGDIGDVEFAYLQTSESKFSKELVKYMLRPVDWVETNWNTLNREVLFQGTEYEQIIDSSTDSREDISKMVMHNEYVDGEYVRKIGAQQWVSDYLTSNTLSITDIADSIRESDVCLGYRCSGFYQKGTVEIITDTYGVLPEENVHIDLIESKRENVYTYSGMMIVKTSRGYVIDGFDIADPYFKVRLPDTSGKKSTIDANGKTFYYYHHYKKNVTKIPYRKEFSSMQEVYDVINGYGKYLTENENWYFSTLAPNGTILDFRSGSETFANWATSLKGSETDGALLLINPGSIGIGNYNDGLVSDMKSKISGFASLRDINGDPIESTNVDVYRQAFNTYFSPKNEINVALVKFKAYDLEHIITFDNTTIYNDVLYNSIYSAQMERFKLYGVKVLNWYGTLYAPGYIVRNDGAIPNYDKTVNDLQYIFDVDDIHCKGDYATYSRGIVGYRTTKTYKDLYKNDKSMFDFYKGAIRHKGTKNVLNKMNRSTNISSTGNNIELYEIWGFREGKFGHIKDNSVDEFILDTTKMIQNPQIITFETATDYYFDKDTRYNVGDICIYNNYEYVATRNNIIGKFNADDWKKIRYVGNYIIFNNDPKWIKKSNTSKINCFKYTDNLLINPIGGFAQINECSYIVPTEEDADNMINDIELGDTVWIVKTKLGDWDVRKKTGVSKYVSLRYFNIEDAVNQKEEEYIYHFTDNTIDYYSTKNSKDIEIQNLVYSDVDINEISCKWGDIGIPEYTGFVDSHVTGRDYKVKLYNTVFVTQLEEQYLNNGTPFQDIYNENPISVSYSDLLLKMSQFNHNMYKFKWKFKLTVDTIADDVKININGKIYNIPNNSKNKSVEVIVSEGDIINWVVSAHGCGERKGTKVIEYIDPAVYALTKTEIKNLQPNDKIRYKLIQNVELTVKLGYRKNAVIYQSNESRLTSEIKLEEGKYNISFVGAGGGAGGGTTCSYDHHRHPGCGAGGGAYLIGDLTITPENKSSDNIKYTMTTGKGGTGGAPGHHAGTIGMNGGDTVLAKNGVSIIYAQGGAGGKPSQVGTDNYYQCGGRACGYGGRLQSNNVLTANGFNKSPKSRNGVNGGLGLFGGDGGISVYPVGTYGAGGTGVKKTYGNPGVDGLAKIVYASDGINYSEPPVEKSSDYLYMDFLFNNSMDYSSYYQPYVIPYNDDIIYFYSYDVLYETSDRPDAKVVSSSSAFYKNRSRSIKAYHQPSVEKNMWTANIPYNVGDTVTVNKGSIETPVYKYFICEIPNKQSTFTEATGSGDNRVVYWTEYAPTYYYKITYNYYKNASETEAALKPLSSYELYEDKECTIRAEKHNGDFVMTCADLQLNTAEVGNDFYLCDKFATYQEITPRYLSEPRWDSINQVGTYDITSGMVNYYVESDQQTIENDSESKVFSDILCTKQIQSVIPKIVDKVVNGTTVPTLVYEKVGMKYSNIRNTVIEHREPSYELKEDETYLYVAVPRNELKDNTPVYNESDLIEQRGVYKDYIPEWEKTTSLPNTYVNTIKYIDYNMEDFSKTSGIKTYTIDLKDENGNIKEFFYKDTDDVMKFFYTPSECDETGKIDRNEMFFYTLNKGVVKTHDELLRLVIPTSETPIYRVKEDISVDPEVTVTNLFNVYYQYNGSGWDYLGQFSDIKVYNDSLYKVYNGEVYVDIEENTSKLYPETSYTRETIGNSDSINDNGVNSTVSLYYNNQSVGRHISTNNIISDRGTIEEIKIFCFDYTKDPMYDLVKYMIDSYTVYGKTPIESYNDYMALSNDGTESGEPRSSIYFYLDQGEALDLFYDVIYTDNPTSNLQSYYTSTKLMSHKCKTYNMFRNNDGKTSYTKLCLYGTIFYAKKLVIQEVTNDSEYIGVSYGTMKDISNYDRVDYTYNSSKIYNAGDLCLYKDIGYECIENDTTGEFDITHWEEYSKDKIVNVITYKDINDIVYITSDNYNNRTVNGVPVVTNINGCTRENGTLTSEGKNGWLKMKYINEDYMFDLIGCERKRLDVASIKSCYLVDNENDNTIVQVQVFDPIQNIIPNNILSEINYISSTDPVNDYTDEGRWSDNKVGFLWWDTSKVRYVDYYQGDFEYRRENWGKQLPGSEIAIMEWTKSVAQPTETDKYVTKSTFNYETSTIETYYYYWKRNPISVPEVSFRTTSAYHIAEIINDPTDQGIIWMSPIDSDVSGRNDNTLIITNFSDVITGQEAVLQINTDSDQEIMDHSEWVMTKENANNDIPDWLWEKMEDSLLGYKTINGVDMPVPDPSLPVRQKLGISFRPRQTMFSNIHNARENFIDALNDIFASRTEEQMMIDLNSGLEKNMDEPKEGDYYDEAGTMLELMSWKDESLVGKKILVRHDETHDNIWVIYLVNRGFTYSIVDYQKYDIKKYINYEDWYLNNSIKYMSPVYVEKTSETSAKMIASGSASIPGAKRKIKEGEIVKYETDNSWKLYQNTDNKSEVVGVSKSIMQIDSSIYDYINQGIDNEEEYINLYEEVEEGVYEKVRTLTKYDYIYDETQALLKILIDYVNVEADD